jgi:hypothetical protein
MTTHQHRRRLAIRNQRALSMVECVFSILLVGGVFVASMNSSGALLKSQKQSGDRIKGHLLATEMLSEILAQRYEEGESPAFGLETGEAAPTRAAFDDVDDYKAYSESSAQLKDGSAIVGGDDWRRVVTVQRVSSTSLNSISATETGVKKITVYVYCKGKLTAKMAGVKTGLSPSAGKQRNLSEILDYFSADEAMPLVME